MLVRFAIEKKSIITSIARIINKRLVIIIDGPCYSIISNARALRLVMGIIELPGLLASVWTWLFFHHVIKQTQKKESIDQKAFNGRRSADKHRQLS